MVICLEQGVDLHMAQLSLAPVKSRLVLPFWYRLTQVSWNFGIFPAKMGQGTVAKILSLTCLGGPRVAHSKNWPRPLRFFSKFGENLFGGGPPRGAWSRNLRGRPELGRGN